MYIDGEFVKGEEAKISVFDHGFLYGDGVFEGIRAYDGNVFALDEHLDRLYESAKALGIAVPIGKKARTSNFGNFAQEQAQERSHQTHRNRGVQAWIDPKRAVRPSVIIMAYPFPPYAGEKPLRTIISSIRRKSPYSVDSKIKSLNYWTTFSQTAGDGS